jgi:F-type H+-transporting ATPase subunit a
MNEEVSWFDFLPGAKNLSRIFEHMLGRETPEQGMYFRWQMFGDSHFTMAHVYGAALVVLFCIIGGLAFRSAVSRGGDAALIPPPRFNLRTLFEMFTEAVLSVATTVMGEKNARRFLPLVGALAIFIFFSNALALIPGFIPPTATLKTNVALAASVFLMTHVLGVREHGLGYFKQFLGHAPIWMAPLMIPVEIIGHCARPVSLSMRLMGNMAADHKLVATVFALVPLLLPVPFLVLGVLVTIIQTLVFCLLSMVYIQLAVAHEEH